MSISVTMSKEMYMILLNGKKATSDAPGMKGCGTPEKVVEYINDTFGLLGNVEEVMVQ